MQAPSKVALSGDEIIAAGLRIARRSGLSKINMRELARELGVTPMAIYHHFDGKDAVLERIVDRYILENVVTSHGIDPQDWRPWLKQTFLNIHKGWCEAPDIFSSFNYFGPGVLRFAEDTLGVLLGQGLSPAAAVSVFSALTSLTIGNTILQALKVPGIEELTHQQSKMFGTTKGAMDALAGYPNFVAVLTEYGPPKEIEPELDLLLDSVEWMILRAKRGEGATA